MKTIWIIGIMNLLWSANSWAASSFCVNSCVNKGYDLNGCVAYCDSSPLGSDLGLAPRSGGFRVKRTDYQCMSDCQYKLRYSYSYCQEVCEY